MTTTLTPVPAVQSAPPGTNSVERSTDLIIAFTNAWRSDVPKLGGKRANLGEMTAAEQRLLLARARVVPA